MDNLKQEIMHHVENTHLRVWISKLLKKIRSSEVAHEDVKKAVEELYEEGKLKRSFTPQCRYCGDGPGDIRGPYVDEEKLRAHANQTRMICWNCDRELQGADDIEAIASYWTEYPDHVKKHAPTLQGDSDE